MVVAGMMRFIDPRYVVLEVFARLVAQGAA